MSQRKISFPYLHSSKLDSKTGKIVDIYRPYIPVQILGVGGNESQPFYALLDSGADRNLFPAALGLMAGLDIRKGVKHDIGGIGGVQIKAYTLKIKLQLLCPNPINFDVFADFSYEHKIPLLGRQGFFDQLKEVAFREKKRLIELKI